jgi:asparagine synthase (glutamine-hydrolysing)
VCGIAGWAGDIGADEMTLRRMCERIFHRGPDEEGYYVRPGRVGLGFRRLSIIDLRGGSQPLANETSSVVATCNGEIYNFRDLRERLVRRGHRFASGSDAEVLPHLWEDNGIHSLGQLQGMFAFALWDEGEQRLTLVRDRLGVKPLYWAPVGDGLVYASEPGAILASGLVKPEPDLEAIAQYLTLKYVPAPLSGFLGIRKLAPGEALLFGGGKTEVRRYWSLHYPPVPPAVDRRDALDQLDALLRDATRDRLISDVPLGAFLSGGIDSSLVVSYMAELAPQVSTFSIDFPVAKFSEGRYARRVAEIYGTRHEEFVVDANIVPTIAETVRFAGEPFADSSAVPTYLLSQVTKRRVTVALSGDGGDEAFGGYRRYQLAQAADRLRSVAPTAGRIIDAVTPPRLASRFPIAKRAARALRRPPADFYATMMECFDPVRLERLCQPDFLHAAGGARRAWDEVLAAPNLRGVTRFMALDVATYLPDDLLTKVDRMAMAHALEVRSPFLDYRVQEFAASLPAQLKLRRGRTKWCLKELALRRGLPSELVHRPKQGFGIPIGKWFREDLRGWLEDMLRDPGTIGRGYFRHQEVGKMLDEHLDEKVDHSSRLWTLAMLELWHRTAIDDE